MCRYIGVLYLDILPKDLNNRASARIQLIFPFLVTVSKCSPYILYCHIPFNIARNRQKISDEAGFQETKVSRYKLNTGSKCKHYSHTLLIVCSVKLCLHETPFRGTFPL